MSIYPSSVDDNDPSVIYSGSGWVLVTQDLDWRGTMHSTSVAGSWARFRFTGSRVVVICTIPTGDGSLSKASFQIDDGPAIPVSHRTTPPVQWQTQFWNSGPLSFGSHLLTITNLDDDAYFRMDRIDFDPTDSNAPRTSNTPRPTSTPPATSRPQSNPSTGSTAIVSQDSQSSSSTLSTGTASSSSTANSSDALSSNSPQSSSSTPAATSNTPRPDPIVITGTGSNGATGAEKTGNGSLPGIIAGVLGGALVLVLCGIAVYCLRRRRRRMLRLQSSEAFHGPSMAEASSPTMPRPFEIRPNLSDFGPSSHVGSPLLPTTQTTFSDSKSRNAPGAGGVISPAAGMVSSESPDTGSDMYTSAHPRSEVGAAAPAFSVADKLPSKATLSDLDQRISLINPSEAPPPAYHLTSHNL